MRHHFPEVFETGTPVVRLPQSQSVIQRYLDAAEAVGLADQLERGDFGADPDQAIQAIIRQINRGITTSITAFPVRENLEAEAVVLTPVRTPLRNRIPRLPGAGTAEKWKQLTAFGANLGTVATTTGTTNSADTIVVTNARGFYVGEQVNYQGTTPFTATITAINYATNVISFGASTIGANTQENAKSVVKTSYYFPEAGSNTRMFYAESGAPSSSTETYADKSASYKLLGDMGDVTLFAMATGANFQNQYATAKRNCLMRVMLKEEYALLHADSSVTAAPWGDGTNALAYQGLIPFINANSPAAQRQSSVGGLTIEHIQGQLTRLWYQGAQGMYIMMNGRENESLTKLATTTGNYRLIVVADKDAKIGARVASIVHAVSGEEVPIYTHPFMPAGTIVFGADMNAMGQPSAQVSVLPQVQDQPETTFNDNIQGYYAQDIAPTAAAPEVLAFKIGLYSVPMWKNSNLFGISTGVTSA